MKKFAFFIAVVTLLSPKGYGQQDIVSLVATVNGIKESSPTSSFTSGPFEIGRSGNPLKERQLLFEFSATELNKIPTNAIIDASQLYMTPQVNDTVFPPIDGGELSSAFTGSVTWNTAGSTANNGISSSEKTGTFSASYNSSEQAILGSFQDSEGTVTKYIKEARFLSEDTGLVMRAPTATKVYQLSQIELDVAYHLFDVICPANFGREGWVNCAIELTDAVAGGEFFTFSMSGANFTNLQYYSGGTWVNATGDNLVLGSNQDLLLFRFIIPKSSSAPNNTYNVQASIRVDRLGGGGNFSATTGTIRKTGDSNTDGVFNSSDLIAVFFTGLFQTGEPASWEEGDWNGDGVFDTSDWILAFQHAFYINGANALSADIDSIF